MPRKEKRLPEPPGRLEEILDFPAETDPPLKDRPRMRTSKRIGERREVEVGDTRAPASQVVVSKFVAEAAELPAVRRLLGRGFVTIGGHLTDSKELREQVAIFYSYAHQWTVEVRRAGRKGEWEPQVRRTQPPLTDEELEVAYEVARGAVDADTSELEVGAIAVSRDEPDEPDSGRRLADVRFFPADRRLPLYGVVVDLADRRAVSAGRVGGEHRG